MFGLIFLPRRSWSDGSFGFFRGGTSGARRLRRLVRRRRWWRRRRRWRAAPGDRRSVGGRVQPSERRASHEHAHELGRDAPPDSACCVRRSRPTSRARAGSRARRRPLQQQPGMAKRVGGERPLAARRARKRPCTSARDRRGRAGRRRARARTTSEGNASPVHGREPVLPALDCRRWRRSLPVADRPRRPEWMKVRAPSAERQLLRREEADPRRAAEHDLRGGALPEHRRVLGPRHRDVPDPRRDLHPRLPLLLRQLRQAERAGRPARAAPPRADREADGAQARRRHVGRPRRRRRPGRGPLRGDDPRAEGEGARRVDRGAHPGLPRGRGGSAADRARRAARRLQPQHRDGAPPAPQDARRQGELRRRPLAAATAPRRSPTTRC